MHLGINTLLLLNAGPTDAQMLSPTHSTPVDTAPRYEENAVNGGQAARAVLPANLPLVVAGDFNSSPAVAANTVAASRCSASYESSSGW